MFQMMIFSLSPSTPEVLSSKRSNLGCFTKPRAKISLCFSPPERLQPLSLTGPSNPPFAVTKSQALVSFIHQISLSSEQSKCWFPYFRLSLKVPRKRQFYCVTYDIVFCISLKVKSRIFLPSKNIYPFSGYASLVRRLKRVDFPDPLGPTMATIDPGFISKLKFQQTVPTLTLFQ